MSTQQFKKSSRLRPRVPLKLRDMDPEPIAEAYNKIMSKTPHSFFARKILKRGVRKGKVLDIACGPGHLLTSLAKRAPNLELHGLDISPNMIKIARRNLQRKGLADKVQFHLGSAYELPFDKDTFDLVINTNTLHCLEEPLRFFQELARVLRPGGLGFVSAYRRDVPAWLRRIGYLNTRYLAWRGIPLDGMGPLIDASYTAGEIEDCLRQCPLTEWQTKSGLLLMTIILKK